MTHTKYASFSDPEVFWLRSTLAAKNNRARGEPPKAFTVRENKLKIPATPIPAIPQPRPTAVPKPPAHAISGPAVVHNNRKSQQVNNNDLRQTIRSEPQQRPSVHRTSHGRGQET